MCHFGHGHAIPQIDLNKATSLKQLPGVRISCRDASQLIAHTITVVACRNEIVRERLTGVNILGRRDRVIVWTK